MTAILTARPRADTEQERSPRCPRTRGNRSAKRATSGPYRTGTWIRSATRTARPRPIREPPWQQKRQIGIPRACTDQARREVKNRRSACSDPRCSVTVCEGFVKPLTDSPVPGPACRHYLARLDDRSHVLIGQWATATANDRPDWWPYPARCGHGHPWSPGHVIVSYLPCPCRADEGCPVCRQRLRLPRVQNCHVHRDACRVGYASGAGG
jgi:hypothetical protein